MNARRLAASILKTDEELDRDAELMAQGEEPSEDSVNAVTKLPKDFTDWVEQNGDKILDPDKSTPYFVKDNWDDVRQVLNIGTNPKTPMEIAEERHLLRTPIDEQSIRDAWAERNRDPRTIAHHNEAQKLTQIEFICARKAQYSSYDENWEKLNFDEESGGFCVAHKAHQFSSHKPKGAKLSGGQAEKIVGENLAKTSKIVEFLPENAGYKLPSADFRCDGLTWDVKYIEMANESTIRSYIKEARKADCVIFYAEDTNCYDRVLRAANRELGRHKDDINKLKEFPRIYVMDKAGNLKCLITQTKEE